MRIFILATLTGIVALNCFLGYSGQSLVKGMARSYSHLGMKLPILTLTALDLPPWFYAVALAALAVAALGFFRRIADNKLIVAAVIFLTADVFGLLVLMWGLCIPHFLIGVELNR